MTSRHQPDVGLLPQCTHVWAPAVQLRERVPVSLYVFDLLEVDGQRLLGEPDDARRKRLLALRLQDLPEVGVPLFPNPVVAESLLDRLINNSHQLLMNGASYRPRNRPGRAVPTATTTTT
jgi:hypothetical protein